jgi:hypothetical protein
MWLYGLAGCGKTVLTSSIVEDLHKEISPDAFDVSSPILLCFFFDFRDVKKQALEEMARSLAYHLYGKDKVFQQSLNELFKECDEGYRKPSAKSLLGLILNVPLATDRKMYLILDALDECTIQRQELLAWIKQVAETTSQKTHLLVTSRKEPDIDSVLGRTGLMDQNIAIQTNIVDKDIRAYVIHRLQTDDGFKRWEQLKHIQNMIQNSLMKMSDGM